MKTNCSHNQDDLILHYYGELNEGDTADIELRLSLCDSCRESLASMQALENVIPQKPSVEIEDQTLTAIRQATMRRIRAKQVDRRINILPLFRPQLQWAAVLVLLVVSFAGGRLSFNNAELAPVADLGTLDRISDIAFDAENGMVQIQYESARQSSIVGDLADMRVQSLLGRALLDTDNPASRLRAARIVSQSDFVGIQPDIALIEALQSVLVTESNEGIRLQAVKALRSLHVSAPVRDELKEILINVLLGEANSALRIEALGLLTDSELISIEIQGILETAKGDSNPFIRRSVDNALNEFQESRRLEELK